MAIAGGECLAPRFAFKDFIAHRALDIAQPDTCNVGGITECRRILAMTNTFGIQYIPHVWGSPIAVAAGLHLVAAMPVSPPCRNPLPFYQIPALEFDQTPNPLRDNLAAKRFIQKDGYLDVPMGPGLGVEIDMGVVERYLLK